MSRSPRELVLLSVLAFVWALARGAAPKDRVPSQAAAQPAARMLPPQGPSLARVCRTSGWQVQRDGRQVLTQLLRGPAGQSGSPTWVAWLDAPPDRLALRLKELVATGARVAPALHPPWPAVGWPAGGAARVWVPSPAGPAEPPGRLRAPRGAGA
jgi:hypothetical protein